MPMKDLIGLDHVVIVVRDLAAAAQQWQHLGFTVSERGTHSAHMGTGNHTIMLGEDYLELLGVLSPTERNAPTRALLEKREGIERAAFTTTDARAGVASLHARGIAANGPIDFSRPVTLPDGRQTEAVFQTYLWPSDERPGGLRIFACQHFTRDAVWLPHLQQQANTTHRIIRIEMLDHDPKAAAEYMARLTDRTAEQLPDGAWRVETGGHRGVFEFMDLGLLATRHPGVPLGGLTAPSAVAIVLGVSDLSAAKRAVAGQDEIVHADRVTVPPAAANGVVLVLQG
jgi:catechol 2,3-dioxygenase-like lactoylglutathione lyase family enzyme